MVHFRSPGSGSDPDSEYGSRSTHLIESGSKYGTGSETLLCISVHPYSITPGVGNVKRILLHVGLRNDQDLKVFSKSSPILVLLVHPHRGGGGGGGGGIFFFYFTKKSMSMLNFFIAIKLKRLIIYQQ